GQKDRAKGMTARSMSRKEAEKRERQEQDDRDHTPQVTPRHSPHPSPEWAGRKAAFQSAHEKNLPPVGRL
ncbi:MAG: hypothetical protein ACREE1_13775, partial [Stellaceae bacterium]